MEIIPQHPMAPLKEPKKSWFSYHHTATTVLIAVGILLIATALAWWQWPKSAEKPGQVTNQNQNPAQPDPTTSSDDQTYRSEKYGFEVMLPEDWVAESVGGSILFMSPEIKRDVDKYRISPPDFAYKNYDVRFTDHSQASQAVSATRTEIINNVILDSLPKLTERYQIIHQTGVVHTKNAEQMSSVAFKNSDSYPYQ